jgi:hypothetical protein
MNSRSLLLLSLTCMAVISPPGPASGAGTVTTCDETSLRAALAGGGTVNFACDGRIVLSSSLGIAADTVLDATGHSIILSGGGTTRVLWVGSSANFYLKHLTVADAYVVNDNGAGLANSGNSTLLDCVFSNNVTVNLGIIPGFGGAISHTAGKLTVVGCTFVGNRSDSAGAAISVNQPGGSANFLAMTNCTVFGNRGLYSGGQGLLIISPVPASWIVNCTFAWNTNGGISVGSTYTWDPPVTLINTIVANSTGGVDCYGGAIGNGNANILVDGGHNIVSDASAPMTNSTSLRNTDPMLGPLGDNGGSTPTCALLAGSPAIDHAVATSGLTVDQRGFPRPYGAASDIGAQEYAPPFVIRGRISGATFTDEAVVRIDSIASNTTGGVYTVVGLTAGIHTVTPSNPGYVFVPSSRSVTSGPDQLNVDFKAYRWNMLSLEDANGGLLHVILAGTNGQSFRVLSSPDLAHWSPIETNKFGAGNYSESYLPTAADGSGFYRTARP